VTGTIPPDRVLVRDPRQPPTGANVDRERLTILTRPYPHAIAGTPVGWSFNPISRRFRLTYRTRPVSGRLARRAPTEIAVPRLQYPRGYRVRVRGARVVSAAGAPVLKLVAPQGRRITVVVAPR